MTRQDYMNDLRQRIIERIIEMKNGMPGCTPQPDCSRDELKLFNALLPDMNLSAGVRDALKAGI